jgi:hypothetical protein
MAGMHWAALHDLLPAYQHITSVSVGNGEDTSFWHDTWLMDGPLADKLPVVYSHFAGCVSSVRDVVHRGMHSMLQNRLTAQATAELQSLDTLLLDVNLDDNLDQRSSFFQDGNGRLMTGIIYRSSTQGDHPCPSF